MTEFLRDHPMIMFGLAVLMYAGGAFITARVLRVSSNEIQQDFEELKDRHG